MENQKQTTLHITKKQLIVGGILGVIVLVILSISLFFSTPTTSKLQQTPSPTLQQTEDNHVLNPNQSTTEETSPTVSKQATSVLSVKQETATSAAITISTGAKEVTGVQLELSFDPRILFNISVKPGPMLNNALVLLKNIDYTEGTMFYAAVIPPTGQPVQGTGEVAVITFNFNQGAINPTTLQFLPKTKVTAKGIEDSVLQKATGITLAPPISFKNTGEMFAKN